MKVLNAIAVALACLCLPVISLAQINKKVKVEFTNNGTNADISLERQLHEVYTALPVGYRISIPLVEVSEIHRDYGTAARRSKLRCQAIEDYYTGMGLQPHQMIIQTYNWPWPSTMYQSGDEECYEARAIYEFQVIREPDLPLRFTHSGLDPFENGCEYMTIDNTREIDMTHSSGVIIALPARAFVSTTGHPIDHSRIDIQFCSYNNKADFLLADITSNSGKRMLESAGMLHVKAMQGDAELKLKPSAKMVVIIPIDEKPDKRMLPFTGEDQYNITDWVPAADARMKFVDLDDQEDYLDDEVEDWDFEWDGVESRDTTYVEDLLAGEMTVIVSEMLSRSDAYIMEVNDMGWINCDRFYQIEDPVNLLVQVPEHWDSVAVRLVFKSMNSVLPGAFANRSGLVKFEGVPAGEEVSLVAFGMKDDKMLWDQHEITLGREERMDLALEEISKDAFLANVEALGN